ncbi:male sterility protein-domain-containing protein [Hypomontagnella submonticulosa]|nr:male sterility protein-domain-containing protein [Hypomontagnella submonticulosa]
MKIDARVFIADPTPLGAAKILSEKKGLVSVRSEVINPIVHVDWQVEAILPEEPRFYPSASDLGGGDLDDGQKFLLTGANTIVGIYTLVELLNRDPACSVLVLGVEKPLVKSDIVSLIRQYDLVLDDMTAAKKRVAVLPGSLSRDNLGLLPSHHNSIGRSVSAIYHFGSRVSLLKSYGDLKRVNVDATRDIIRLAALQGEGSTAIHYLSSWSVVHLQGWKTSKRSADGPLIKDERVPDHSVPTGDELAYFKTRWVAEMLLTAASKRGIASAIYRISGLDIQSGEDNLFLNTVNGIVETGLMPRIEDEADGSSGFAIDVVPPAYVAPSVVRLAAAKMSHK